MGPGAWIILGSDMNFIEAPTDRIVFVDDVSIKNGAPNVPVDRAFHEYIARPLVLRKLPRNSLPSLHII